MEGEVGTFRIPHRLALICLVALVLVFPLPGDAQEAPPGVSGGDPAQITLQKFIKTREFQGREIEGEERAVRQGDSLWRMLVRERKLSDKKFQTYIDIIRVLNPQLKSVEMLRVGERIFIPLRLDDVVEAKTVPGKETPRAAPRAPGNALSYRVKSGDHLLQILNEQLRVQDKQQLAKYFALVKDLNPEKKNWDLIRVGEIILLPSVESGQERVALERKPESSPKIASAVGATLAVPPKQEPRTTKTTLEHDPRLLPAREHLALLEKILETLGCELQRSGEEAIPLKEGTIRIDKRVYPVAYNPKLRQKIVIDPDELIPTSLRAKLGDPSVAIPVLPIPRGASLQDIVARVLLGMGYQVLPSDRPVIIQDDGIAFEAKGSWMVLPPEESNKPQEIVAVNVTDRSGEIPEYLRSRLATKGLYWKDVSLPQASGALAVAGAAKPDASSMRVRMWPRDKQAVVDALLLAYGIPFGVAEPLSINLRDGLHVDARSDRIFQVGDQRMALFFQSAEPEIKKILQEKQGMKTIELEVATLSSREIIGRLLTELGEKAVYGEHRFTAAPGGVGDRLMVTTSGFLASQRSLFVTDREIPASLQRFFFERGWEIVYFE